MIACKNTTQIALLTFQLELAHWFYLDEYVSGDANRSSGQLRSCTIREFAAHMFKHIKFLSKHVDRVSFGGGNPNSPLLTPRGSMVHAPLVRFEQAYNIPFKKD
jgi:hypothetical protein